MEKLEKKTNTAITHSLVFIHSVAHIFIQHFAIWRPVNTANALFSCCFRPLCTVFIQHFIRKPICQNYCRSGVALWGNNHVCNKLPAAAFIQSVLISTLGLPCYLDAAGLLWADVSALLMFASLAICYYLPPWTAANQFGCDFLAPCL